MQIRSVARAGPVALGPVLMLAPVILLLNAQEAHAYLDAGSASLIFQAVIAGVLGASYFVKIYWRRITSKLGFSPKVSEEKTSEPKDF
jgi:hypothetical protein